MRRLLTGLLSATLLLGACGDDDGDDPDRSAITSIPDDTSTTSSTTTTAREVPPPDVIPQDVSLITEEYVEQVVNDLLAASNEALLLTKKAGVVDERVIELVEATTGGTQTQESLNSLIRFASTQFEGLRDDPTGLRADVVDVVTASHECVFAEVALDRSGVVSEPQPDPDGSRSFVSLAAASRSGTLNTTAWVLTGLPASTDGSRPSNPCEAI